VATPKVFIDEIRIFPDLQRKTARTIVSIRNPDKINLKGSLALQAKSFNSIKDQRLSRKNVTIVTNSGEQQLVVDYKIPNPQLWSEFSPALYKMSVSLKEKGRLIDNCEVDFGMREFKTNGTRFEVNGHPIFLRGTTECCIFPLTGYPPSDVNSWEKVLQKCKDYGLNHVRFHSFCPPEAAFIAADKLGIYFHIECSSWANREPLSVMVLLSTSLFMRKATGSSENMATTLPSACWHMEMNQPEINRMNTWVI
jgi:beta-galactosidase/beta-glucuronidase